MTNNINNTKSESERSGGWRRGSQGGEPNEQKAEGVVRVSLYMLVLELTRTIPSAGLPGGASGLRSRRIYRKDFRDFIFGVISPLGYAQV